MDYHVTLPYPKIKVESKNINYANIISLNFSGYTSEFSAVTQYTFHEIYFLNSFPSAAKIIKGISEVEMHHMQILGELITKLGGTPGYWINNKKKKSYWSPTFLNYNTSLEKAVVLDINNEKNAIKQYKDTINQIDDKNIIDIINRIILDEEYHIQLLTNIYTNHVLKA